MFLLQLESHINTATNSLSYKNKIQFSLYESKISAQYVFTDSDNGSSECFYEWTLAAFDLGSRRQLGGPMSVNRFLQRDLQSEGFRRTPLPVTGGSGYKPVKGIFISKDHRCFTATVQVL